MKRFPSLATALRDARATLARFPLAIVSGLGAVVVMLRIIDGPNEEWHYRLLITLILGLPLFTASVTTAERHGIPRQKRWLLDLAIAAALVVLYRKSIGRTP